MTDSTFVSDGTGGGRRADGTDLGDAATEVLAIDAGVRNAEILLAGLVRPMQVVRLEPGTGGLEQIARALDGQRGIEALHVISRGEPGVLSLAGERIDLAGLVLRPVVLSDIAAALSDRARVVLYGCSVAAGRDGMAFLDRLEDDLGVSVAASSGPVGSAARGGAWVLRTGSGEEVATAFSAVARADYPDLLRDSPDGAV